MKVVSDTFKKDLEFYGKMITSNIYIGEEIIEKKNINSINYHYEADILKSAMKQCDIELDGIYDYKRGTIIEQINFGVKGTSEDYEYISWNEWVIDEVEISEDEQITKLTCYDKMIYSMIDYDLEIEYPITVGMYLKKICDRLGLNLKSAQFVNSNVEIEEEKYLGLGYTFRDVLDEIAQVSAGTIAIDDLGWLEVMYVNNTESKIKGDKEGNTSKLTIGKKIGPINSVVIARTPQEDNIYIKDDESIEQNGLFEVKIANNQIIDSHREDFKEGIFNQLNGLTYYTYELESYGICYLDLMDMFELKGKDEKYYPALMLNDDIKITQDLWETSNCEEPETTETDYLCASETDKTLLRTIIKVNKQEGKITELVEETKQNSYKISQVEQTMDSITQEIKAEYNFLETEEGKPQLHLEDSLEFQAKEFILNGYTDSYFIYPSEDLYPMDDLYALGLGEGE